VRMLLVSGDRAVSAQVTTALAGRADLDVTEVATPQRALQQLDDEPPFDIVVGDNDTHPTGGFYLAREVAARRQMGRAVPPVVLLIARKQDAWLSDWAQADAWVCKPADPFDLAEVVDALAAGRPLPALPGMGGNPKPSVLDPAADPAQVPAGEPRRGGRGGEP
jgi:CheY-like chemotaxis protein